MSLTEKKLAKVSETHEKLSTLSLLVTLTLSYMGVCSKELSKENGIMLAKLEGTIKVSFGTEEVTCLANSEGTDSEVSGMLLNAKWVKDKTTVSENEDIITLLNRIEDDVRIISESVGELEVTCEMIFEW